MAGNEKVKVQETSTMPHQEEPASPSVESPGLMTPRPYAQPAKTAAMKQLPDTTDKKLLSTYLVEHPTHTVGKAIKTEFPHHNPLLRLLRRFRVKHSVNSGLTEQEMAYWEEKGPELRRKAGWKFAGEEGEGTVISDLFWKVSWTLISSTRSDGRCTSR